MSYEYEDEKIKREGFITFVICIGVLMLLAAAGIIKEPQNKAHQIPCNNNTQDGTAEPIRPWQEGGVSDGLR